MSEKYDVIIVGAGPAGIFAALEFSRRCDLRVAIFDKGPAIEKRHCPTREGKPCAHCQPCAIMTGWGGAGAFSIIGTERVWIRDSAGHIRNLPIADLEKMRDFQALSFNQNNQVVFANVQAVIQHPFKGALYRLYTTRGIVEGVSGEHSLFTVMDQKIRPIKTCALSAGDYILAPNTVPQASPTSNLDVAEFYLKRGERIGVQNGYARFKDAALRRWDGEIWKPLSEQTQLPIETLRGYRKHGKVPLNTYVQVAALQSDARLSLYGHSQAYLPPNLALSPDLCELLGFFAAEGSRNDWKSVISQSVEIEYLEDLLARNGWDYTKRLITNNMGIPGRTLWTYTIPGLPGKLIADLTIDEHTGKKLVPACVLSASPEQQSAFLRGFFYGDGSSLGGGKTTLPQRRFHNTSLDVVNGICYLLLSLGKPYSIYQRRSDNPNWSDGYEVRQRADRYGKSEPTIGELALTKILRIETYAFEGCLYDLVVPGTQAFAGGTGMIFFHNSDGKLTLSPASGGHLDELLGEEQAQALIDEVDRIYLSYGASPVIYGGPLRADEFEQWEKKSVLAGLRLVPVPIRHLGTEHSAEIMARMYNDISSKCVQVFTRTPIARILVNGGNVVGVETKKGQVIEAAHVIVAPGREGAGWLKSVAAEIGLALTCNPVDLGVRVELPATVVEPVTNLLYEFKFLYYSRTFDDLVRTFCICPHGEVSLEYAGGVTTVNGHSYADHKTLNTNFALLVSKNFTEPFDDPVTYGQSIARLANLLGSNVLVQRLGDLEAGRRTNAERLSRSVVIPTLKSATPGDLGLVLPYRHIVNLLEMLHAMDKVMPGVCSPHTLLYGVEVKFYSNRLKLTPRLETEVRGLYACGDGAGITRGLVQASASGLIAARAILGA